MLRNRNGEAGREEERKTMNLNLLVAAIAIFGLGWTANELTDIPALVIVAVCFMAIIGILVLNARGRKK
jgi:uncharacterized membrane protein